VTVAELIEALRALDPSAPVLVHREHGCGHVETRAAQAARALHKPDGYPAWCVGTDDYSIEDRIKYETEVGDDPGQARNVVVIE